MNPHENQPLFRGSNAKSTNLQERVGQLYYSYGLLCSSHPICVLSFAITVALLCCYPLINLPIPGSLPVGQWVTTPNYTTSGQFIEEPWCYVQQVLIRISVIPWASELTLGDAFRAPIYESFKLLDSVRNYQDVESQKNLGHLCLHVEAIKRITDKYNVLPEYTCLVLSPANFWQQDVQVFIQDNNIIGTIYNHQNLQKGKTSIADMLFGMHLADTGVKRYPLRNRRRILQYSITLFFKEYDEHFITGLRHKLQNLYPLHQDLNQTNEDHSTFGTFIIQYPSDINFYKFIPLILAFCVLFFYYYFSVRKIEMIKSKIGMAFVVVVTVFISLIMTLGYCFFFGLTLTIQGKEIFPFMVMLVGLENVLVLTKSVVTTSSHLDIKIRVAQGLSKEGWSITKNLMIEITILTIGIFTFVPVIQEFCIFAVVALVTDFFLQIFFFSTILGIDTRRHETAEKVNFRSSLYQQAFDKAPNVPVGRGMVRSKSHPRLNTVHTAVVAGQVQHAQEKKIPKRLRVLNIWARTRFFQRSFMILLIAWISMILYKSGFINQYILSEQKSEQANLNSGAPFGILPVIKPNDSIKMQMLSQQRSSYVFLQNHTEELEILQHPEYPPWLKLSTNHWPSIFRKYNVSLAGKHIAILPNIKISHAISPEEAVLLRNPDEKFSQKFQWNSLAAALDPIDFNDLDHLNLNLPQSERPLYPTSPMEMLLVAILCLISVIVLAYMVVVLYKCICSRNYAEWRASWTKEKAEITTDIPILLEAVPMVLNGHLQEVECLATDGTSIVSSCLGGQLKVWDSITGELQSSIDRYGIFNNKQETHVEDYDDNIMSDYESGSPPSREGSLLQFPSFKDKISFNFSNASLSSNSGGDLKRSDAYDFGDQYRQAYSDYEKQTSSVRYRNRNSEYARHRSDKSEYEEFDGKDDRKNRSCDNLDDNFVFMTSHHSEKELPKLSPIWCIDYLDNLIVLGCADGRLEFWEGTTGKFKYIYDDNSRVGITSIKIVGSRVIAARLYGSIDILQLQSFTQGRPIDWNFSIAYRRTHVRTSSAGSIDCKHMMQNDSKEDMRCFKVLTAKAHQQPINCLDCEGGRILSGSQDHTLKVFRLEDGTLLYTLHGHCGPITCLFIDRACPGTAGSGSQDGMLCIWDLLTGTCMYSIQAHDGSVVSLTYSVSYMISLGADERICVWERFQGHLLTTIHVQQTFTSQVQMLSSHLVVTARAGSLVIYDVRTGESVRSIILGRSPFVFVKHLLMLRDSVLCDFGNQLKIVRFPIITRKYD